MARVSIGKCQRDFVPAEAGLPHVDGRASAIGSAGDDAAFGLDPGIAAFEQGHAARGIAAGLDLAAVGVEDAHAKVGQVRRLEQDELVASNAGTTVGERARTGGVDRDRLGPRVEDNEVVAEPVHLVKPHRAGM
jgi:hypothetical protein